MQQTFPKIQEPLGRPPNSAHTEPEVHTPASPFGVMQASSKGGRIDIRPKCGLKAFTGRNRLLKTAAFSKLPRIKRLSAWFFC